MNRVLLAMCLTALSLDAGSAEQPSAHYIDLTSEFIRFTDETAGMHDAARVVLFHEKIGPLLPGFYEPRFGATPAQYDQDILRALARFAELRPRYEQVQREFPAAFDTGIRHFRKVFPTFAPNAPVYLLHSLGEMDGGTRELNGKTYLIFGADLIAKIHEPRGLTPFLVHELFHVEHGRHFTDCEQVWCLLWAEGIATYAAKVMNPGADDQQLLLTVPAPIRAAVDANWSAALCFTRARLFSAESADTGALFVGGADAKGFPQRFGYYVGLRVAEEAAGKHSLPDLARMPPEDARAALTGAIDRLVQRAGGCR